MKQHLKKISVRALPINYNASDKHLYKHEFEKNYYEPFLKVITNCYIGNHLSVIKNYKIVNDEEYFSPNLVIKSRIEKLKIIINSIAEQKTFLSTGIFSIDNWSKGYFHWFMDVLPKLISLPEKYGSGTLLLPKEYQEISFITETLTLLNFDKIYYFNKNEIIKVQELIIPGIMAETGNYNDRVVNLLRDELTYTFSHAKKQSLRILILRNQKLKRKIINENEIIELVNTYGFIVVCFEELPWREQVALIESCSLLIGLHGAGLTNMLFMRKGSSLLELRRKGDHNNNCYFSLASALELNYFYQLCEVNDENISTQENDFLVDKDLLERNIKAMIAIG